MVRELAGHDPDEARRILRWPLREALLAYLAQLRRAALEQYRWDLLIYNVVAPWAGKGKLKPPKRPRLLEDD